MKPLFITLMFATWPLAVSATPIPYNRDERIQTLDYRTDQVLQVPVSPGVVTRIVLEPGEKIVAAATGVPAKCETADLRWCIVAQVDASEVWIKPRWGAARNNLELKTDRRDYSFELIIGKARVYRVALRYPDVAQKPAKTEDVAARLASAQPVVRNKAYRIKPNGRGADITPKAVFDDGALTYFQFPGNGEIPTVFVINSDGTQARVNVNMTGDYVVAHRLGRQFILRLGKAEVTIWNDHFDTSIPQDTHTAVAGIVRDTIGGSGGDQ